MAEYDNIWDEIKSKVSLVEEMEKFGIAFLRSGNSNRMRCVCPFHNDTDPSMIVNIGTEVETYKCFGCQAHGSVIDFIKRIKGDVSLFAVIRYFQNNYHLDYSKEFDLDKLIKRNTTRRIPLPIASDMLRISNTVQAFLKASPSFKEDLMKIKPYLRMIDEAANVENYEVLLSNSRILKKEIKKIKEIRKQIA